MDTTFLQVISLLVVTSVLTAAVAMKSIIKNNHSESYHRIVLGLFIIDLMVVSEILSDNSVFSTIPFLNSPIFFDILHGIGMITGLILLVKGISTWMPVFHTFKKLNTQTICKLELFKKIDQLLYVDNCFKSIFESSGELIANHYKFIHNVSYIYSQSQSRFIQLGEVVPPNNSYNSKLSLSYLPLFEIRSEKIDNGSELHTKIIVPLHIRDKIIGAWVFISKDEIENMDISNLRIIANVIADKADHLQVIEKNSFLQSYELWKSRIDLSIDEDNSISQNLFTIKSLLSEVLPFEYLSLSIYDSDVIQKYTISDSNRILTQHAIKNENIHEIDNYMLKNRISLIINNLEKETTFIVDPMLLKSDMKSYMGNPILEKNITAVLTVSSKLNTVYSESSKLYLKAFDRIICRLISSAQSEATKQQKAAFENELKKFNRIVIKLQNRETLYDTSAQFIYSLCNSEFVRLSRVDDDGIFINSQSLITDQHDIIIPPSKAPLLISLLPIHKKAIQTRQVVSSGINNKLSQISETERNHIYGKEFSSIVVVPVIRENKVAYLCSIGFNQTTITENDLSYIEYVVDEIMETLSLNDFRISIFNKSLKEYDRAISNSRTISSKLAVNRNNVDEIIIDDELVEVE